MAEAKPTESEVTVPAILFITNEMNQILHTDDNKLQENLHFVTIEESVCFTNRFGGNIYEGFTA